MSFLEDSPTNPTLLDDEPAEIHRITIEFNGKHSVDMVIECVNVIPEQIAAAAWLMEMNAQDMFMQQQAIERYQKAQQSPGGIELARALPPGLNRAARRGKKN